MHILIVDDEADMRMLIDMYLRNSGFETTEAQNYEEVKKHLSKDNIDLILLDIMLPGKDGFEICKEIRLDHDLPIIFLTAKGEEWDKVKGLQLGGDDYIVKPFSPGELVARIEAVLRRYSGRNGSNAVLKYNIFELDEDQRKLEIAGEEIPLTFKEFELLRVMMGHPGKVFTREALLEQVWDFTYQGGIRTVDTHIKTLRMKLGEKAGIYVQTVWGSGYKFEAPK